MKSLLSCPLCLSPGWLPLKLGSPFPGHRAPHRLLSSKTHPFSAHSDLPLVKSPLFRQLRSFSKLILAIHCVLDGGLPGVACLRASQGPSGTAMQAFLLISNLFWLISNLVLIRRLRHGLEADSCSRTFLHLSITPLMRFIPQENSPDVLLYPISTFKRH